MPNKNPHYFNYKTTQSVEPFEGGLFVFPCHGDGFEWDFWDGRCWKSPKKFYGNKCFNCGKVSEGINIGGQYITYFCDDGCRVSWYEERNEAVSNGALEIWGMTLWDERFCIWYWGG